MCHIRLLLTPPPRVLKALGWFQLLEKLVAVSAFIFQATAWFQMFNVHVPYASYVMGIPVFMYLIDYAFGLLFRRCVPSTLSDLAICDTRVTRTLQLDCLLIRIVCPCDCLAESASYVLLRVAAT